MGRYDQPEQKKPVGVLIGTAAILLAAGGWIYWNQLPRTEPEPETMPLALPKIAANAPLGESVPFETSTNDQAVSETIDLNNIVSSGHPEALPELSNSDPAFREALLGVSQRLAPWLNTDQLIRKYLVIVNDFSQGLILEKHMRFLKLTQPFGVEQTDDALFMSKQSYQRYDELAEAINAMDANAAAAVYRKFKPLLLEVFNDFGYPPERPLEELFLKSANQILAAPIIEEPIALIRPSVYYKYADQKLEGLSPVGKQMLRMGPKNTRIIQNKTRQLIQALINTKD